MSVPTVRPSDIHPGPRDPSGDERLERLLIRNAFVQDRDDRRVPGVYDDLVRLVWVGDEYVTAIISRPDTPLQALYENLRRPVGFVIFEGTPEQLAAVSAPNSTVQGRQR